VKYVLRDLPLESIHPFAFKAAEATHCAGDKGKYWEMHDRLFGNQRELARKDLSKHAEALGLDVAAFDQCLDSGKHAGRIRKDMAEAQRLQTTGTPTFFLGLTDANGTQVKGTKMSGAQPYDAFKAAIDRLLSAQK
jgi:protein-disulfide isomerase